jgi:hypothetical protein
LQDGSCNDSQNVWNYNAKTLELQALQQNSCNISDLELQALQETITI